MRSLSFPYLIPKPSIMKKIFVVLSFICLAVACVPDPVYQEDEVSPVKTLRATFMDGPETRTEFGVSTTSNSFSQIKWKAGDQINVFASEGSAKYASEEGGVKADFNLVSGDALTSGPFLGLSPYAEGATADLSAKTISTTLPAVQQATVGNFDPAALLAVGSSTTSDQMAFYNVCSGLRFTLTGTVSNYKSIELSGNNGEKIAGAVSISCSKASAPVVSSAGSTTVSLVLPDGKSFEKNKNYYLVFAPGVFKKGFKLTFKNASGSALFTCTCSSYVEFKRSTFASIDGVDDPKKLAAIRDGDLLSTNGTANCYIVSKAGSYKFPLSRATEKEFLSGITTVKVLWETDNTTGSQSVGSIITNVGTNKKYVFFDTPSTLKSGNAVIAAYQDSKIVWSWHIWVCDGYNPSTSSQTLMGKSSAMMDRNLGALSASPGNALTNGLFYQWGRKDPFPGAAETYVSSSSGGHFMKTTKGESLTVVSSESVNATEEYAKEHPDTYITTTKNNGDWLAVPVHTLWGTTKTIYDPCPAGWRVPDAYVLDSNNAHVYAKEAWSTDDNVLKYQRVASNGQYGVYLYLNTSGTAWYPNNGYISLAGKLLMVGQFSCYWSCNPNSLATYCMEMSQAGSSLTYNGRVYGKVRGEGHSVRCIKDK